MAVAVVLEFEGGTLDQYDQVVNRMGFSPGGPAAPGGLFHWVTKTDNGFRVTDVWRSRDQFEKFADEQIGPYGRDAGLNPPGISFIEVHNYLTAGPED
jgi:hypothetical protein